MSSRQSRLLQRETRDEGVIGGGLRKGGKGEGRQGRIATSLHHYYIYLTFSVTSYTQSSNVEGVCGVATRSMYIYIYMYIRR